MYALEYLSKFFHKPCLLYAAKSLGCSWDLSTQLSDVLYTRSEAPWLWSEKHRLFSVVVSKIPLLV